MRIEEKRKVWNQAIRAAANEVRKFDGILPDKIERNYIADSIIAKWSYKRLTNKRKK